MASVPRLFVSHSHEDDVFCQRLVADLRAGLGEEDAVWYDTSGGLHGGDAWWDRIVAEITERPYFLVVLSPAAAASRWVPQEMAIAFRQHVELGKRLLPVRLAQSPRRADWAGLQEFDFQGHADLTRYTAGLAELGQALGIQLVARTSTASSHPSVAPTGAEPTPAPPLSASARLAREVHTAYGREHWSDVLDKTDVLVERGAMTPVLWRERASAAFARGDAHAQQAVEQALHADPDDVDTLLLRGRLLVKASDDAQAVTVFTRAYALAPLDEDATRLLILDDLIAALGRLKRWDAFAQRLGDAQRLAPGDPQWTLRPLEPLLAAGQIAAAVAAVQALPTGSDATALVPAWHAALLAAQASNDLPSRRALLEAAPRLGVDAATVTHWRRFDVPRFAAVATLTGHTARVNELAWAPDGTRLATRSDDRTAKVWEAASGRLLATLTGHSGVVNGLAWAPDGTRLATASADRTAKIWVEE